MLRYVYSEFLAAVQDHSVFVSEGMYVIRSRS